MCHDVLAFRALEGLADGFSSPLLVVSAWISRRSDERSEQSFSMITKYLFFCRILARVQPGFLHRIPLFLENKAQRYEMKLRKRKEIKGECRMLPINTNFEIVAEIASTPLIRTRDELH